MCDVLRVEYTMCVEPLTPAVRYEDRKITSEWMGGRTRDAAWNHQD